LTIVFTIGIGFGQIILVKSDLKRKKEW